MSLVERSLTAIPAVQAFTREEREHADFRRYADRTVTAYVRTTVTESWFAILVGLVGLFLTGQTLNLMTLGGLALAIGMLVDDATVGIESIHRNLHLGKPLTPAILAGSEQIATPALAATLTICIVFFPVVLLEGPARFLFTPLALGVVVSMLASYVLSRTLVPMLARQLMEKEDLHYTGNNFSARFNRWRDAKFGRFQEAYGRALQTILAHRALVLVAGGLVLAFTAALPFAVGLDFFPTVDAGQMRLHYRAPIGTRLEETEQLVGQVEKRIQQIVPPEELDTINSMIGMPVIGSRRAGPTLTAQTTGCGR